MSDQYDEAVAEVGRICARIGEYHALSVWDMENKVRDILRKTAAEQRERDARVCHERGTMHARTVPTERVSQRKLRIKASEAHACAAAIRAQSDD